MIFGGVSGVNLVELAGYSYSRGIQNYELVWSVWVSSISHASQLSYPVWIQFTEEGGTYEINISEGDQAISQRSCVYMKQDHFGILAWVLAIESCGSHPLSSDPTNVGMLGDVSETVLHVERVISGLDTRLPFYTSGFLAIDIDISLCLCLPRSLSYHHETATTCHMVWQPSYWPW